MHERVGRALPHDRRVVSALDHLQVGQKIVDIAFGILFGGIVLSLALSVGLGSRELVSRSIERETSRASASSAQEEEQLRHF